MNSTYKIKFTKKALKFLAKQDKNTKERIIEALQELSFEPYMNKNVKALKGYFNTFRLRVGDIRVIYELYGNELVISVIDIGYRGDVYK